MGALQNWIDGSQDKLVWIDYTEYATKILGRDQPWISGPEVAGVLNQGQALLKSEVIPIDAGRILLTGDTAKEEDSLASLLTDLQNPARIQLLEETLDALSHGAQADLVLQLPGLKKSLLKYGADEDSASDFGNLDDLGAAFTDILRRLAEKPLDGLLLVFDEPCSEDEFDALGPVTAAAAHYGWLVASELSTNTDAVTIEHPVGELILMPQVIEPVDGIQRLGGGLSDEFWSGEKGTGEFALHYGRIPKDGVPEIVLAQRQSI